MKIRTKDKNKEAKDGQLRGLSLSVLKGKNKRHLEKVYKFENAEKKLFFF